MAELAADAIAGVGCSPATTSMRVRVEAVHALTSRVMLYDLRSAGGGPLPAYDAGAHIRLPVQDKHGLRVTRSYSLVGVYEPGAPYQIAVQREDCGQGGSVYVHEHIKVGCQLEISAPVNKFPLAKRATRHVLIAGGIGITPLLSMARHLNRTGEEYVLHYAARTPEDMAFRRELERECGPNAHFHFDGGNLQKGMHCGELIASYNAGSHVYTCGPRGLIEAVRTAATAVGWPEDAIHHESFAAVPTETAGDLPIEVVLSKSGETIRVASDESILDALLRTGIETYYDCRVGECGSCVAGVLGGVPLHRDVFLNAREQAEGKQICICVSRASTHRLILDL